MNRIRLSTSRTLGIFADFTEHLMTHATLGAQNLKAQDPAHLRDEIHGQPTIYAPPVSEIHPRDGAEAVTLIGEMITLAGHIVEVAEYPTKTKPLSLSEQARRRHLLGANIDQPPAQATSPGDQDSLINQLASLLVKVRLLAARPDLPTTVTASYGIIRLGDCARLNLIILGRWAQRCGVEPSRDAMAEISRTLATILGEQCPGHSIEVRIPPFAAIQLGSLADGPVHRRGTPPTVVETDPATFLALCSGELDWQQAKNNHQLTSSGIHGDEVATLLPLLATHS